MTTKPFDNFNKRLFQTLLSPLGIVFPNFSVLGEERMIDIFFAPYEDAKPSEAELGVFAKMLDRPALLEPYRSALCDRDIETCIIKLFGIGDELRQQHPEIVVRQPPHLWILAAEVSDRLLRDFGGEIDENLGDGFYRLDKGWRSTIVAIEELPITAESLWLRLMGKGTVQSYAVEDLLTMREDDIKRSNVLNFLAMYRINIELRNQVEAEEAEVNMALSQAVMEWEKKTRREGREQGVQLGRAQGVQLGRAQGVQLGREEECRSWIIESLTARYGAIDPDLEALIPQLMQVGRTEYMRLLFELSKEDLIQDFKAQN
jgi:hypothetical protein